MNTEQKALIVWSTPDTSRGLDELNRHLRKGWRVQQATPMGATGGQDTAAQFAVLVIVQRTGEGAAEWVAEAEEELEELLDDVVEADGTNPRLEGPPS